MGNEASFPIDQPDTDEFSSIFEEVSSEIDHEYQSDAEEDESPDDSTNFQSKVPDSVASIPSIRRLFSLQKPIGRGVSGDVYLARSKQTQKLYALKRMSRSDGLNHGSFLNEIKILKALDHPNIVRLHDTYISKQHYCLTTEHCSGGSLLDKVFTVKQCSEKNAATLMRNLLEALHYLHQQNIVHRDIKLSNIVFDRPSKVKLIDFGLSERITNPEDTDTNIFGSLPYLPPEMRRIRSKHELYAGDMWSAGIVAYVLVQRSYPYRGNTVKAVLNNIKNASSLKWHKHTEVSDECKDFIQSLLHKDVSMRLTAKEALQHPWIVGNEDLSIEYVKKVKGLKSYDLQNIIVHATIDEVDKKILFCDNTKEDELSHIDVSDIDIDAILAEIEAESEEQNVALVQSAVPQTDHSFN
eukprot:179364_1